jgi:hypothetical protein
VGPTAVLDAVVKRKIPSPRRESNPGRVLIMNVLYERDKVEYCSIAYCKIISSENELESMEWPLKLEYRAFLY